MPYVKYRGSWLAVQLGMALLTAISINSIPMETKPLIVSLTTWKGRIRSDTVQKNISRLLRQKTKADYRVVLVLSTDEFPKKEREVPGKILDIAKSDPRFSIVWQKANTRALKKLTGAQMAFPGHPVLTTDDDIAVKDSFVEDFWRVHREHPREIIGADVWFHPCGFDITGWARLFPADCLAKLPDSLFMKYFRGLEDDVWNGLRACLVGTRHRKLGSWPFVEQVRIGDTALSGKYLETDPVEMLRRFAREWKA